MQIIKLFLKWYKIGVVLYFLMFVKIKTRNILKKKIHDEVTEDIFDMSNVRIFKEIEKKNLGDVYTLLGLRSAKLS